MALTLTTDERTELERRVRSLKIRAEDARRARVILMLANGEAYSTIEATVPCYRDYINRWRRRFLAERLEGLRPRYRGQPPTILTPTMEARILAKTRQAPPDGSTHWSTRKLGRLLKIHHNLVAKAWQRAGLQPHREQQDPDEVLGLGERLSIVVMAVVADTQQDADLQHDRDAAHALDVAAERAVRPAVGGRRPGRTGQVLPDVPRGQLGTGHSAPHPLSAP